MSYQEIYRGLNKRASAEQVKELAHIIGMRKKASMKKQAVPAWLQALVTGGVKMPSGIIDKTWKIGAPARFIGGQISKHPTAAKVLGGTALASVPVATFAMGNSGKAELKGALDRANATNTKLTEQNKKLRNRGIWDMIMQNWDKFSKWFADLFKNEPNKQPTTQGNK